MPCIARSGIQKNRIIPENPGSPGSLSEPGDDELQHSLLEGEGFPFLSVCSRSLFPKTFGTTLQDSTPSRIILEDSPYKTGTLRSSDWSKAPVEIEEKKCYIFEAKRSSE
jgi:hypothetical protein